MAQILVVDDEVGIRELLSEILADEGYDVSVAENAAAARAAREAARPDLVLLDVWMPDTDGITLLKEWAAGGLLTMPVVIMSGHGTIDTAVEATRIGALDYLEKPIALQKLLATVRHALNQAPVGASQQFTLAAFTRSPVLRDLRRRLDQLLASSRVVMLRGPAGGAFELVARSALKGGAPWLDLGRQIEPVSQDDLRLLRNGVVFAAELGRLSRLQQKNVLFAAERTESGGYTLITGTAMTPEQLQAVGWDTHQQARLAPVWLNLPSLETLREDIPELASHILRQLVDRKEVPLRRLSAGALNALRNRRWAGDYAELHGTIRTAALNALEEEITPQDMSRVLGELAAQTAFPLPLDQPLREAREAFERLYFEHHMRAENGNMTRLAEKTGIERTHLYRKLRQLGLHGGRKPEE